jgi:hypothetical protein
MEVTTSTFSFTQVILAWTLLGILLTWLITFIVLALRSYVTKKTEWEDTSTASSSFPAKSTPTQEHADGAVLVSAHSPVEVPGTVTSRAVEEREPFRDIDSMPVN